MKASDSIEKIVTVVTRIAFGIAVLLHLGFWLAMILNPTPSDVPLEFINL